MDNRYDIGWIVTFVEKKINEILKMNLYEAGLSQEEIIRLRSRKNHLRDALSNCGVGDENAKAYIKEIIEGILKKELKYTQREYDRIIPFTGSSLSSRDKFDSIMDSYKKKYGKYGLERLVEDTEAVSGNIYGEGCYISKEDINIIYDREAAFLGVQDKVNIIVQRIYSMYRGLGVIDDIRDMKVDGVSGGVSGTEGDYGGVWIFYKGINIHLRFLTFDSEAELERVCMNIYRYGNPGQLSKSKGYIIGEMKDHSRVVVVRPPFSESFAFFVRKFDTIDNKSLDELIRDKNSECVIDIIKWIVKGCQVTAVTGSQGSGKTTLLMSMIHYISPLYSLRIQEMAFELHLRDIYPNRNILTFRETDYISGQTGLDVQKKTDGAVNILGEVATIEVAAYLIQMSQVGSLFTLFTHHAKNTESLIKYMRNSLLSCGLFSNEEIAREQVIEAIRFDIHMEKDIYGHRYIERISEIVQKGEGYSIVNIVEYTKEGYIIMNPFSEETVREIKKHLTEEEMGEFVEKHCVQNMQ